MNGEHLIFLISQPRAGSTMLQRIFAAHSEIATASEPWVMLHPIYALRSAGHTAEYNAGLAHSALQIFLSQTEQPTVVYDEALRAFAQVLYGSQLTKSGKRYFLDKTPRYYLIISELGRIFPEAKFVFLLRNPLAVLSSILKNWIGSEWRLLAGYRHDLLTAPPALLEGAKTLGDRAIVVRYEDLVLKPEATLENVCRRLAIGFESNMIHYGAENTQHFQFGDTDTVYARAQPVSDSLNIWFDLADNSQTFRFAVEYLDVLGTELLGELGYSADALKSKLSERNVRSSTPTVPFNLVTRPRRQWSKRECIQYRTATECQQHGILAGRVRVLRWRSHNAMRRLPFVRPN